jgi:predicted GTPase
MITDYKTGILDWDIKISRFLIENEVPSIHIINKCDKYNEINEIEKVRINFKN